MNKLLTILLAGTFAAGAAVAATSATGVNTGDLGASNTASGTGAATAGTKQTTTAEKRAMRTDAGSMGAAGTDATVTPHKKMGKGKVSSKAKHSGKAEGEQAGDRTDIR